MLFYLPQGEALQHFDLDYCIVVNIAKVLLANIGQDITLTTKHAVSSAYLYTQVVVMITASRPAGEHVYCKQCMRTNQC